MSLDQLEDHVWHKMGSQKLAVGRWRINRLTRRCVKRWPQGDEVTLHTPGGLQHIEVLAVRYPAPTA